MRVGVLGLGSIGLRHAQNIRSLGGEVLGFDPSEERQALLTAFGGVPAQREAVLACDRLVVGTPTAMHYQDILDCQKPTLLEKPVADRGVDGLDLSHIHLVGYNLRYHSAVRQAKQWIDGGTIGKPLCGHFLLAQFNDKPAYLRDGVILNWSHEIDLAIHLLGKGSLLSVVDKNKTIADLFLQHSTGATSAIHLNYVNKREVRRFQILGDQGRIDCVLSPWREANCETEAGDIYGYRYHSTFDEDYIIEMRAFLEDNIGPGCTASEAVNVLEVCLGGQ